MMRRALLLGIALVPLAGCRHPRAAVVLPPAPPAIGPVMVSVPPPTHPTEPLPKPAPRVTETTADTPAPARKPRHRKAVATAAPTAPTVAIGAPPVPAIELGQLSAGGTTGTGARSETEGLLNAQKQRLDHLPAATATAHAADVEQARRFLKSAEDAWKTGDMEGAHTLVVKAKVLLDDLTK